MLITSGMVWGIAVVIYLFDCLVLLPRGQAIATCFWRHWAITFGSRTFVINKRVVALLNPFTPFAPSLKSMPLFEKRGKRIHALRAAA